jgi:hypothetical protein
MIFNWHVIFGVAAALIGIGAIVPYVRDMIRGETRPNIVSWGLWALTVGISAAAQFVAEPSWSGALVAVTFFGDSTVLILAIVAYGYAKYYWWDGVCLILSIAALVLWGLSGNPLVALGFAILADGLAFIPTYIKSYREPFTEPPLSWLTFGFSGLLALGGASTFDFPSIAFPLYYFVANCLLGILIVARRRLKK